MATDPLARAISRVVDNDNCSGCGGCALVFPRVSMISSEEGFDRPSVSRDPSKPNRADARVFRQICPGVRLTAPPAVAHEHQVFGRYWSAWQGVAVDPEFRRAGSSGGVLTALAAWLVRTGKAESVAAAGAGQVNARRTVPVQITSRAEALRAAGSRYAPVPTLTGWEPGARTALIAKPCEIASARAIEARSGVDSPAMLSFFCAGTPSQNATDRLIRKLLPPRSSGDVASLQYRGDGWPGSFRVHTHDGETGTCSYEESWGKHLGTDLQWRCKLCIDGTGMYADISVGDFWEADERGFPLFSEADGNSVIIARTERGHHLLQQAARDGVIAIRDVDLDDVARVQPLQTGRRAVLGGRLFGRLLGFRVVPVYRGFGVIRRVIRFLFANVKASIGTFTRTVGLR